MTTPTYYAAIDEAGPVTGTVYGGGTSPSAAIHDAQHDAGQYDGQSATFRAVPCTVAAYVHVTQYGGAPSLDLSVSRDGVCLRSEEE